VSLLIVAAVPQVGLARPKSIELKRMKNVPGIIGSLCQTANTFPRVLMAMLGWVAFVSIRGLFKMDVIDQVLFEINR